MQFQINGKKNLLAQAENNNKKLQLELKMSLQQIKKLQEELKKSQGRLEKECSDPNQENSSPKGSNSPKKINASSRWKTVKETFGNDINQNEFKIKTELEQISENKNFDFMPIEQLANFQRSPVRIIKIIFLYYLINILF
jgi:hypothetical protein